MVFSSVSAYLDPSNWQPQHINHQIIGSSASNPLLPSQTAAAAAPPPPPQPHGGPGSGSGSIRPGSMSERARQANIPMPESALKCPRCESTNTKFCYFNNYSLSQPRHFCKTCRRYWTRGGALRSVPVGGGCRRNKRSGKSTASSKSSPASSDSNNNSNINKRQINSSSTGGNNINNNISTDYGGNLLNTTPPFQPMQFMSPLSQLSDSFAGDVGLSNYVSGNIPAASDQMGFHGPASSLMGIEPWRLQQFSFLGGLDPSPPGVYQFHGDGESGFLDGGARPTKFSSSLLSQMASVKMEDNRNPNDLSLSRQLLGGMQENHHHHHPRHHHHDQWNMNNGSGGAVWTEISGFSSPSTSNHLQ